ncbi:MAG: hypothetical protein ACI9QL_001953 [Candidatus Omnitrophota bacterium]|jgi:hypothetical protein
MKTTRVAYIKIAWISVLVGLCAATGSRADFRDDIGLTRLLIELAANAPSGSDIKISQVEAFSLGSYYPDGSSPDFAGQVFIDQSNLSTAPSGHASNVGRVLYGGSLGVAPGIRDVDSYEATDWYSRILMRSDNGFLGAPLVESAAIQNHSWVASRTGDDVPVGVAIKIIRLFDYQIARDHVVSVVSLHNDPNEHVPDLLSHNYNAITVGKTSGVHSSGGTLFDGVGRVKPDLVAPAESTSFAVPMVSGAAAILLEEVEAHPALADAGRPTVIKALLMAGATKQEFSRWTNQTSPLDPDVGAGELNVYNSYQILHAGEQDFMPDAEVTLTGWDYGVVGEERTNHYFMTIPADHVVLECSAMLVWNRRIIDTDPGPVFEADVDLPDHDLLLHEARDFEVISLLNNSRSRTDNVEHIYHRTPLEGGLALSVASRTGGDYAIAWRMTVVRRAAIRSIEPSGEGAAIHAEVETGLAYALQASDDYSNWVSLGGEVAGDAEVILRDARPFVSSRSYRVAMVY